MRQITTQLDVNSVKKYTFDFFFNLRFNKTSSACIKNVILKWFLTLSSSNERTNFPSVRGVARVRVYCLRALQIDIIMR